MVDRFQGQADIPLDEVGRDQAVRAAEVLAAYRPSSLYSSDLSRCYQTAAALAERTGLEIITDKRLREIHVGSWEGLLGEEIRPLTPSWRAASGRAKTYADRRPARARARSLSGWLEVLTEIAEAAEDHCHHRRCYPRARRPGWCVPVRRPAV